MKMKRTLLAASLMAAFGAANAAGLSWNELSTATRTSAFNGVLGVTPDYSTSGAPTFGGPASGAAGTTVSLGYLSQATAGDVRYTVLGQESAFSDNFKLTVAPGTTLLDTAVGASATSNGQGAGSLSFRFEGDAGRFAVNDGFWCSTCSIGLIGTGMTVGANTYDFVIGYNDSAGGATADWDDMVIGVSAIPEPETYAMLLAGLGLMGFVARRRQRNASV